MTQFTVTLTKETGTIVVDETPTASSALGITRWQRGGWTIICWGDPAQKSEDPCLVRAILNGDRTARWGRSWIAINHFRNTLHAAVDTVGLFPIWFIENDQTITLTNARDALLSQQLVSETKADALYQLLAYGQLFDDDCIWKNTTFLVGGSQVTLHPNGTVELYTDQGPLLNNWETTFDSALDAFVESVRKSLSTQQEPLVSLSGGLDSRLILAAATALGKKVTGLTYGHADSGDVTIAKALARATDTPLFTGQTPTNLWDWSVIKRVARAGAGEVPLHHAHALLDGELLEQTKGKVILTGTGAETSRAFYYDRGMPGYSLLGQRGLASTALFNRAQRYIRQEFTKTAEPFFHLLPQGRATAEAALNAKLQQHIDHFQTPALYLDNFYLQNRVPRMVASGQQLLDTTYLRTHPFLDKDALFYMAHLPIRYKLGSTFHRKAIQKLAPHLADIPWDKTDRPLSDGLPFSHRYPALVSRLGIQRWGKLAKPLFNYEQLNNTLPETLAMRSLINLQGQRPAHFQQQFEHLRTNLSFAGFSAVWSHLPVQPLLQTVKTA